MVSRFWLYVVLSGMRISLFMDNQMVFVGILPEPFLHFCRRCRVILSFCLENIAMIDFKCHKWSIAI